MRPFWEVVRILDNESTSVAIFWDENAANDYRNWLFKRHGCVYAVAAR